MKKLICFLTIVFCISSANYAFCPFEDHFTIADNTALLPNDKLSKFMPFNKANAVNIGVNTDITGNINGNTATILQNTCSNWGNGLAQIRIGKDNENYCDIDIWDGAEMPEATLSRVNCIGTLKDRNTLIGLTHTFSTFDYQITVS